MRSIASLFIAVLALVACDQTASAPEAPAAEAPAPAAPVGEPMSVGMMGGMSTTASGDVSALTIGDTQLAFANADSEETFTTATEFLGVRDAADLIAEGGETFAASASRSPPLRVELRRISGAAPERLCGGIVATHVALIHDEPLTGLTLVVFSGADAPSSTARDTAVCATYLYGVD